MLPLSEWPLSEWPREQLIAHLVLHDWVPIVEPAFYTLMRGDGAQVWVSKGGGVTAEFGRHQTNRARYLGVYGEEWKLVVNDWSAIPPEVLLRLVQKVEQEGLP